MLKSEVIHLEGRDKGKSLRLTELPALVADRHARVALEAIGIESDAGVVGLALEHLHKVQQLGVEAQNLLLPFVNATHVGDLSDSRRFSLERDLKDWRNVARIQQAALLLHVGFIIGRSTVEVPVTFKAAQIMNKTAELRITFASPHIGVVLDSRLASYRELETVLSTEDVFNLVELHNVSILRDWHANQTANP